MRGRSRRRRTLGIQRAVRWGREDVLAGGKNHLGHRGFAHGTVVRSVTAAAGGKTRVVGFPKQGRQRADGEEEDEEDGEGAPHLHRWYTRPSWSRNATSLSGIIES